MHLNVLVRTKTFKINFPNVHAIEYSLFVIKVLSEINRKKEIINKHTQI